MKLFVDLIKMLI